MKLFAVVTQGTEELVEAEAAILDRGRNAADSHTCFPFFFQKETADAAKQTFEDYDRDNSFVPDDLKYEVREVEVKFL